MRPAGATLRLFAQWLRPTTICKTPTRLSWGFFLGDHACCPVFLRVHAETCGLRPLHYQAGSAPGFLSSGHFSQYP